MKNLKQLRESLGLTQTEFAKLLCMGLRNYQRVEDANQLSRQAEKILCLMINLKEVADFIATQTSCDEYRKGNVLQKRTVTFLINDICKLHVDIEKALGKFID